MQSLPSWPCLDLAPQFFPFLCNFHFSFSTSLFSFITKCVQVPPIFKHLPFILCLFTSLSLHSLQDQVCRTRPLLKCLLHPQHTLMRLYPLPTTLTAITKAFPRTSLRLYLISALQSMSWFHVSESFPFIPNTTLPWFSLCDSRPLVHRSLCCPCKSEMPTWMSATLASSHLLSLSATSFVFIMSTLTSILLAFRAACS